MHDLRLLPKVDLHIHLDGSVRPATILSLAEEEGVKLPELDLASLSSHLQAHENCGSLEEYLSKFDLPLQCLQSAKGLSRAAFELVEDAYAHNVRYVEVRFAPLLHIRKGLSIEDVIANVLVGLEKGERAVGTVARIIIVCLRSHPAQTNLRVVDAARQFQGKGVVGIDLAGDEANYPPYIHRDVFRLANRYGFPITIHAGEAAGAENILESVRNMYACRIGHGVRLKENRELMQWVKDHQIALEMCLTSNVQTKAVPSWKEHPIKEYFEHGIMVTVNTDNLTVSGTNLTQEFERLVELYGFSIVDLGKMILNSMEVSFLEQKEKQRMIQNLKLELQFKA